MIIRIFIFFFFATVKFTAQISIVEKFTLPVIVNETSGLLVINNKIVTHNDSGDGPKLYEIDATSGLLHRTITITNASNIDWEDLAEDETHIYIGDFGNNNGNRQDLKIYKISKSEFENNSNCSAEIINFSYQDQNDFTNQPNANNFDAEAMVIYENHILIFTKNWQNFRTKVYQLPKNAGTYEALKVSEANVEGLITGATNLSNQASAFFLCGYDSALVPFLIFISDNRSNGNDIFSNGFTKISLINELGAGNQVEGIYSFDLNKLYLSREFLTFNFNGTQFIFDQKLYEVTEPYSSLLANPKINNKLNINIYIKNNELVVESDIKYKSIEVYNINGQKLLDAKNNESKDLSHISDGFYLVQITLINDIKIFNKIIKF